MSVTPQEPTPTAADVASALTLYRALCQEEYLDRVETLARSMYDAAHDRIWSGDHAFLLSTVTSASFWREMASVALVAEEKWQRA